jgi:hypothetical protein
LHAFWLSLLGCAKEFAEKDEGRQCVVERLPRGASMMDRISEWLYPELRGRTPRERQEMLMRAREGSFDLVELVGLAIALTLTVLLTRYSVAEMTSAGRFAAILANFLIAIPLLVLFGGPFYFRRTRRHLRKLIRDGQTGK